ncbi:hypothetical protein U1Q18_007265, partial [Sarracenia purpurea var. burkii]
IDDNNGGEQEGSQGSTARHLREVNEVTQRLTAWKQLGKDPTVKDWLPTGSPRQGPEASGGCSIAVDDRQQGGCKCLQGFGSGWSRVLGFYEFRGKNTFLGG